MRRRYPAEWYAVGVRGDDEPVGEAVVEHVHHLLEPVAAVLRPRHGRLLLLVVADVVESDVRAAPRHSQIAFEVDVDAGVGVTDDDPIWRQSLALDEVELPVRRGRQVGQDRHARGDRGPSRGPVELLVELGEAADADAHLDHAGFRPGVVDADRDLLDEEVGEVLDGLVPEVRPDARPGPEPGAGDEVDAGRAGDDAESLDVAGHADPRQVDVGATA